MIPPPFSSDWSPSASIETLKARAKLYAIIRTFFLQRDVLEIDVPMLGRAATVDPHIHSLITEVMNEQWYLQTSPEFFLKRLLASGSGDIYSLGKAFRQGEKGQRHHPEFTLLEWYRVGWNEQQLIQEVVELIERCSQKPLSLWVIAYRELFLQQLNIDPHVESLDGVKALAKKMIDLDFQSDAKSDWLDLLMTHVIEPRLPTHLVAIYDYPAEQAALARIENNEHGQAVAKRFEIYWQRIELANGYWELTDAREQQQRFERDQRYRQQHQLPDYPYDQQLVQALSAGLPDCAGVALGIDRLLMLLCEKSEIRQVLTFVD